MQYWSNENDNKQNNLDESLCAPDHSIVAQCAVTSGN